MTKGNNNNTIQRKMFFFFCFGDEEGKHRQPTMKHQLVLSLMSEQNLLI
jgi:hypothetical protein